MDLRWRPSPNFGPRRGGVGVRFVVLHYTAMASAEAALERLCAPEHEVSAHYLIGEDGALWQMVREEDRAWHAGAGAWGGVEDVNSASVGVELANAGDRPFSEAQMARLEALLKALLTRHGLPPEAIIGHSDMAPGRKGDPGPRFDWRRLAWAGLSVWPQAKAPEIADPERFVRAAGRFGYGAERALETFRLRFRPWAGDAPLDGWDVAWAEDLARRFPVVDPAAQGA